MATATEPERFGAVIAIGGALRADNAAVWQRVVDEAGGRGARFVVIAAASEEPEQSAAGVISHLQRHGAAADHLRVAPRLKGHDWRAAARDPALVAQVRAASGVYFTGGAQALITQVLLDDAGGPTPVLQAIRELHQRGGVIAGSSAGAAVMSRLMFSDPPGVLDIMKFGPRAPQDFGPGLGFIAPHVLVDQHFLRRGRIGRMLRLLQQERLSLGVGVEENAAAVFRGHVVEAIGNAGVVLVDMRSATTRPEVPHFNLRGARLSLLTGGDSFDMRAWQVTPSAAKRAGRTIDPRAAGYSPEFADEAFYPEMLGDNVLATAMTRLIDSRQDEILGTAFGAPNGKSPAVGFEFRLSKGPGSLAYSASGSMTVHDILLDVTPVLRTLPLYSPVPARANAR